MASMVLTLNNLLVTVAPDEEATMKLFQISQECIQNGLEQFTSGCAFQALAALAFMEANKPSEAIENVFPPFFFF